MASNENFGIAKPKVRVLSKLPKVSKDVQVFNFDMTAHSWGTLKVSPFVSPVLMENVTNPEKTFSVCFPSKRKVPVDNIMADGAGVPPPTPPTAPPTPPGGAIIWTPVSAGPGVINDYIAGLPSYSATSASTTPLNSPSDDYKGPIWIDRTYKEQPQPDDEKIAKNFFIFAAGGNVSSSSSLSDPVIEGATFKAIRQNRVADGLWWGIESNDFLQKNMPFWLTLEKPKRPPAPAKNETFFIISLGLGSTNNTDRYDIVLGPNKKPTLIDYYGAHETIREFEGDASRILTTDDIIEIGIMSAGGRLIIFVNGSTLVYTRVIKTGANSSISTIKEANISEGNIRVYGSNLGCTMYACPMAFAQFSALAFPIPTTKTATGQGSKKISYSAPDAENAPSGKPVCILPVSAGQTAGKLYGVDAKKFSDANGSVAASGFGLHGEGFATFTSAGSLGSNYSALPNTGFFLLTMKPEDRSWLGRTVKYAKPPYFFRLKGVDANTSSNIISTATDITDDIISVKETASAPDYFHVKRGASFTLYNEGGQYDYLIDQQFGIDIGWGWNGKTTRTFTGMNVSATSSQIAGKETLTVQCEDYNYILQNTPIVNSPFYDGMVGFHAVKDLAKRAGLKSFQKDWPASASYFLKSGYSFSSPQMRFKSTDRIFDCIMGIVKRFEAYIYFDGSGTMHIDKLPGGLLGSSSISSSKAFTSDPTSGGTLILENKSIDIDLRSTVNHISVLTLDRDTRYPIFYSTSAKGSANILGFRKSMMIDQPAYGELAVAKAHALELSKRLFKSIRKTSFKTVGSAGVIEPLSFVTVDGVFFRLISLSRDYNAETNDFVQNYECEWLNG